MKEVKDLILSFAYAFSGIGKAIRNERNFRIHIVALLTVTIFNLMAGFSALHWAVELLCCMVVMSLELVNTAVEKACNAVTREDSPLIGFSKDAAAGAVLVSAIGSVVIAFLVFFSDKSYGENVLVFFMSHSVALPGLILFIIAAAAFVFLPCSKKKERKDL